MVLECGKRIRATTGLSSFGKALPVFHKTLLLTKICAQSLSLSSSWLALRLLAPSVLLEKGD